MGLTQKDRVAGGNAVVMTHGIGHMSKIGKRGRKKQLQEKKKK